MTAVAIIPRLHIYAYAGLRHILAREAGRVGRGGAAQLVRAYTSDPALVAFADFMCAAEKEDKVESQSTPGFSSLSLHFFGAQ